MDLAAGVRLVLEYTGTAYELTSEIPRDELAGAGVQLRRSADGSRPIDAGVHGFYAFVNRRGSANRDTSGEWQESRSPFDPAAGKVRLRVLVDTSLALFTSEGPAVLKSTVTREFTV